VHIIRRFAFLHSRHSHIIRRFALYMKILQINKFYYLAGGTEKYLFGLSRLLKDNGHEVLPFAMQDKRNKPTAYSGYFAQPVDVRRFSFQDIIKTFYNYDATASLKTLLEREKPDIAHLHNIHHHLSPAIIRVLAKHGIPMVMTLHDYRLLCPNRQLFTHNRVCYRCLRGSYYHCVRNKCIQNSAAKSLLGALESGLYERVLRSYKAIDRFIAPSRFMKRLVVASGLPEEKVAVANNFIEQPEVMARQAPDSDPYLLYYGRLTPEKGVDVLLSAFARTKSRWQLKIVGDGPAAIDLQKQSQALKTPGRVEFLGAKYGDELHSLLAGAQAVVVPSRWLENMPYVLLESLAAGKPVLASRSGGVPELVRDGRNGFLFEPGQVESLAQAIERLEKADLEALAQAAYRTVARLDPASHYLRINEIYNSVLHSK